ncbi:hypothetical protein D9V29_03825 [Mycetocola manganoxydans]|uniref:Uncharacterized protein n=1 Tax=Mycetocola manganoxydans TaxID=699879 RepID=A0A3L6ZZJ7_9MICO|nr:hypothetical protein [Mycetocola manganoxydans]RLP73140.1 hypothetical protein D9V29_03825 [Mycetocola manganoxydans]GHD43948.1 hypothetical protein GCM10008097_11240 [Mycetocola manganoxydans]
MPRVPTPDSDADDLRRQRSRRLLIGGIALVAMVAIAGTVLASTLLAPATGIRAALESDSFAGCVSNESRPDGAPALDGTESWTDAEEQTFWTQPAALHCASIDLGEDRRTRALSVAFTPEEGGTDVRDQWQVIADYVTWLADDGAERDMVMLHTATLMRGMWVADADRPNWAEGVANIAVLSDQRARGELPGYEDWLSASGAEDTAETLHRFSSEELRLDRPENDEPFGDFLDRSRALLRTIR